MQRDRIEELARRASRHRPLFPPREKILECHYWTAKNGHRFLVRVVRDVGGKRVESKTRPPWQNPDWIAGCEKKRRYRQKWIDERGEAYLEYERELKRQSRARLGRN